MDLFNLFWQQHPNPNDAAVALGELGNTLALDRPVRAAIQRAAPGSPATTPWRAPASAAAGSVTEGGNGARDPGK